MVRLLRRFLRRQPDGVRRLPVQLHLEARAFRGNAEGPLAQLAHQVEGRARGLLQRQLQGVAGHLLLHRLAHLGRGGKEAVRRGEAAKALVGPLEVVGVQPEGKAPLQVGEVLEDGAGEKLLPQRLPEALHLAQRRRVVGAALHVPHPEAAQLRFEFRGAAPGGVLPAVVRQHLLGRAVGRKPALEGLQHQAALLVVGDDARDDEARAVVQEGGHVDARVAAQQEGENVRLPQLVGPRPLEARLGPRRLLHLRRLVLQPAGLVQDAAHEGLTHPEGLEAGQHVANAPRAPLGVGLLVAQHALAAHVAGARRFDFAARGARLEALGPLALEGAQPVVDGFLPHPEGLGGLGHRRALLHR
ncbi:MAG TPA: hypothetical protein VFO83_03340, partial [Aggregicoccus sp.]|nr:hypothetical protein [Aggregicoccus sp.]